MRSALKLLTAASALVAVSANANINWSTGAGQRILDQNGAPLQADALPALAYNNTGYYVQLVWAGPDGLIAPINLATYVPGTSLGTEGTDDVVIDLSFIGRQGGSAAVSGVIINQSGTEPGAAPTSGALYYVRAFNAPLPAPAVGSTFDNPSTPPPSAATFYGNSALVASSVADNSLDDNLVFNGFQTLTPLAVPEPTTASLIGMGIAGVAMALKRRRQLS